MPAKSPVISLGNIIISFFIWDFDVKQWKFKLEAKYEIKYYYSYTTCILIFCLFKDSFGVVILRWFFPFKSAS